MKANSIIDYAACILLKTAGPLIRLLHPRLAFWLGRRLGDIIFTFDVKHRSIVYSNLKTAFGDKLSAPQISRLALQYYRSFGQNIIEIFLIPVIDGDYVKKYVHIEGLENVNAAFARGKGVIFVSVHEGSWELSSILAVHKNIPFSLFVREQNMPRLNELLNSLRVQKGCRIIRKEDELRELIRLLRKNESCGMSADQGGRSGMNVRFFNKDASMASGAVRLALKYGAALVPVFSTRVSGPDIRLFISPAIDLRQTADPEADIKANLEDLVWIFQKYLYQYPQEYLWQYRIWKYSRRRDLLIISDGKTGHLRQSEAVASIVKDLLKQKGIDSSVQTVTVAVRNRIFRSILSVSCNFTGRATCQGCMACLRSCLTADSYSRIAKIKPDIIISCGSSTQAINRILALENQAKSVVIMKPVLQSCRAFDLVIAPRHDDPPVLKNVVVTRGALNLVDEPYLKTQGDLLERHTGPLGRNTPVIGVLLGGDSKNFKLEPALVQKVIGAVLDAGRRLNAELLVTTSRRTPAAAQNIVKEALTGEPRVRFLVLANEKNFDFAVGGILAKSDILVISPESISMVSEAASSGKHVIVFDAPGVGSKHLRLLADLEACGFIVRTSPQRLPGAIDDILKNNPAVKRLDDASAVREGLRKIL
jgi:KDO2-lipid IV(A) lauroyltransferase